MVFDPIHTERLVLRAPEPNDAEAAYQRKSLPEVARYQDWELPYTRERAEKATMAAAEAGGPADGTGWNLTVVDGDAPDRIMGDVYIGVEWGGRSAEIGFTFHPDYWGHGYASEAAQAIVRYLFCDFNDGGPGISRVRGSLHPDNVASARVLEACGMVYEGRTVQSFWVGDECSDDVLYGMTRAGWEAWCDRPRHRPDRVEVIPITPANVDAVGALATHKSQQRFVSPVLDSYRDSLVPPELDGAPVVPWYRAIEADGELAGFIMAAEVTETHPNPFLWRLLVDRMHQRRGIGSAALELFEERCRQQAATAVEVTWVEGPGSPAPMYRARGYEPSGRLIDGEIHAVKQLVD